MRVEVLLSPYDSGNYAVRMGKGPLHFQANGLETLLAAAGHEVQVRTIEPNTTFLTEIKTAFDLHRLVAEAAHTAQPAFVLLLSGNCNTTIGAVTGLGQQPLGLVWFDAHGEYNTPETTTSGFLDGMGLAIMTGRCWCGLSAQLPGFAPLPAENILLIGGRAFDPAEETAFAESSLPVIRAESIHDLGVQAALEPSWDSFASRVQDVYLHLDLDALDPAIAQANQFPEPDGLTVEQVEAAIQAVGARFRIRGMTVASYDPTFDSDSRTLKAGLRLIQAALKAAETAIDA